MQTNTTPLTLTSLSEREFMGGPLEKLEAKERNVDRIYTDPVGIPTMGIGKALALRSGARDGVNQYQLMGKSEIEALVRNATGDDQYRLPDEEYGLLENAIAHTNAGKSDLAKRLIPPAEEAKVNSANKFGFTLPPDGARRLAEGDIKATRDRALTVYRSQAKDLGWPQEKIDAYEAKLKNSSQMMALTSMQYNAVAAPKATRAVLEGDAAEAYKEIVYRSNGGTSKGRRHR